VEPGDRSAQALNEPARTTSRLNLRIVAACVVLVGVAFIQSPGLLIADTKFDLAVDPANFLARALHLWDAEGAFGQLQNQAYGYLWPMGPFFALGAALDLQGWVVQRLWMALVMVVAFVGTARLARALGARSDLACLAAGFAFALSPRMLSTLGPISVEAWPSALAPWVLLPLVRGATEGSPRRMAMLSALAVAMVGGVNAAATFAVLPLGVVWLLTREPGPRRRSLMIWWPVFTALGTLWWLVPLFVMGAYSPPFLDFIETASVTTFPTTPFDALRGTSDWVPYVDTTWQGGFETLSAGYLALHSGILLMLGVVGMMLRGNPHRHFLALSLLLGLVLVTMGHQGATQGWLAGVLHLQLDEVLAPLRNVHKFDPVVRLPLVLGLAWVLDSAARALADAPRRRWVLSSPAAVIGLAVVALIGSSLPATSGQLATTRPVFATPGYWAEAAEWLKANADDDVALLAPGSSFGSYVWGEPRDEPLQYLADSRWAVRNAIPLAPAGNIRMLDAFEARLNHGRPSAGLAPYLRRAGVKYVVVRNDLRPSRDVPDPTLVHHALAGSPGIELVETFGPEVGGGAALRKDGSRIVVNGGWQSRWRAIEVFEVAGATLAVGAHRLPVVAGGPEDLLDLADHGVLQDEPVQLAADVPPGGKPDGPVVLTDGLLDRERFFGRVHDGYSAVRTPGDDPRSGNPVADYRLRASERWTTSARLSGARAISASSSMSDSNASSGSRPGELPFAAVDDDPQSSWVSNAGSQKAAWWRVDLDDPVDLTEVEVTLAEKAGRERIRVLTAAGRGEVVVLEPGTTTAVGVRPGSTRWLRVEDASGGRGALSLAEVSWPGRDISRALVLPTLPEGWGNPDQVLLRALRDPRTGCTVVERATRCVEDRARPSEEPTGFDRVVTLTSAAAYVAEVTALPRPGIDLLVRLQEGLSISVTGSSSAVPDTRATGLAATDGDRRTTWTPSGADTRAQLNINWIGTRAIRGLRVVVERGAPARRPTVLQLTWPGGTRTVAVGKDGRARFAPIRTDRLAVRVTGAENAFSIDQDGVRSQLPVGIGEIRLRGLPLAPISLSRDVRTWRCGSGPTVVVNGVALRTRLRASPAELFAMLPVPAELCRDTPLGLRGGENTITVRGSDLAVPEAVLLGRGLGEVPVEPAEVATPSAVERRIEPVPGAGVLVTRENANPGWEATQGGRPLASVVVDGWQQGWLVDGGPEPVRATFAPDRGYRLGLVVGAGLFVLLLALALVPARRWPGADLAPTGPARIRAVVLLGAGLLGAGLLGGWAGAGCFVVAAAVATVARRGEHEVFPWLVGSLPLVAATAYFVRPWGSVSGWAGALTWPHYLVMLTVSAVVVAGVDPVPGFRSLMAGRSTRRYSTSARASDRTKVSPKIWRPWPRKSS
jgi:arabinofuranan 3-O-arabinosyltransferase